jgi:hypothetical protein
MRWMKLSKNKLPYLPLRLIPSARGWKVEAKPVVSYRRERRQGGPIMGRLEVAEVRSGELGVRRRLSGKQKGQKRRKNSGEHQFAATPRLCALTADVSGQRDMWTVLVAPKICF